MTITPSASYGVTLRVEIRNNKKVAPAVGREVVKAAQKGGVARRRRRTARS